MSITHKLPSYTRKELHISFVLSAVLMTLFLCYIDEGYYDFRWMSSIGNWLVFFIYVAILFLAQELVALVFFWLPANAIIKSVFILSGLALGIWFCFRCFSA